MKLFWLENRRWNLIEFVGWACTDWDKYLYTSLSNFVWEVKTTAPYENTWIIIQRTSWYSLASIVGDNKCMFSPLSTNSTISSYYADMAAVSASYLYGSSWTFSDTANAWIFYINFSLGNTSKRTWYWTRLMYL